MASGTTARKSPPRKSAPRKPAAGGPVSRAEFTDLLRRVEDIEAVVNASKLAKQREMARKLAENPEQLAQLQQVLALAKQEG